MTRTSETHPIRVDFIEHPDFPVLSRLGMTFAPGKKQAHPLTGEAWDRDLVRDVERLADTYGTDVLVSLLEHQEFRELDIVDLWRHCTAHAIDVHHYSIPDQKVPTDDVDFRKEIKVLVDQLESGKRMVVHCKGGLGRTGTVAACMAIAASNGDISGDDAIAMVRRAREGTVENSLQDEFVRGFSRRWLERRKELEFLVPQRDATVGEDIFVAGGLGGGACVKRFKASDGRWYYYRTSTIETLSTPDGEEPHESWKSEPFASMTEALADVFGDGTVFAFYVSVLHPDYGDELKAFAEMKLAEMDEDEKSFYNVGDEPLTADAWMERSRQLREAFSADDEELTVVTPEKFMGPQIERTGRNFLLYWKFRSIVTAAAAQMPLDVISSRQLSRVGPGDRIWVVTVDGNGRLLLAGQMKVERVTNREEAVRETGDTTLWNGGLFALADPSEDCQFINIIDIHHIAPELRFGEDGTGRFTLDDARVNPLELQQMREVTPETSAILYREWDAHYPYETASDDVEHFDEADEFDEFDEFEESDEEDGYAPTHEDMLAFIAEGELLLRDNPDDVDLLYNLGVTHGQLGDDAREVDCYNRALIVDPDYSSARFNLACAFARAGEFAKARDELRILIDAGSDYAPTHFMMGTMEGHLGNPQTGIAHMQKGLEIDPEDPNAHFNLGKMYMEAGDFGSALRHFDESLEYDSGNPAAHYLLGKCYMELGDKHRELDEYLRTLDIDGTIFDALFAAGTAWAHLYAGEEGRTVGYLDTGGEMLLDDPLSHFHMGLGLLALDCEPPMVSEAEHSAETVREMDPDLAAKLDRFIAMRKKGRGAHRRLKDMTLRKGDIVVTLPGEEEEEE